MLMTFLTVWGLGVLAMLVLVALFACCAACVDAMKRGDFLGWYFMQEAVGGLFQLLGLVLMALVQVLGEASKG